jgi:type II secretory ATPase GspE/PulE/Tfp pilus assembly ATPase PilB-like protein
LIFEPGMTPTATPSNGLSEGLFFRHLQAVSNRIHSSANLEQIMLGLSAAICELFQADRLTIYAVSPDGTHIVSRIKTGLQTIRELRLPINAKSVAGYVALQRVCVNLSDAQDEANTRRLWPELSFLKAVDKHSGYVTRQLLTVPIVHNDTLFGVLQLINTLHNQPFNELAEDGAKALASALGIAFQQRQPLPDLAPPPSNPEPEEPEATAPLPPPGPWLRYQALVQRGLIDIQALVNCLNQARDTGTSNEEALVQHGIRLPQQGQALATYFEQSYEGFKPNRLRVEGLHGLLKRDFVATQQWLPLEETPEGLVVLCLDPEATRNSRMVPQVYPKARHLQFRVTTATEFQQTVDQLWPQEVGHSIDTLLADLPDALELDPDEGNDPVSAAADNELVKLVNKIIIDAHAQGASDIHIEPQPGKAKTLIRFRVDGTLRPYIEVPAAFRAALVTRLKIMCDLDISERRKPQDGKIQFKRFGPLDIELRVATLPSAGGVEDVVMRLLAAGEPIPLDKLGLTEHNRQRLVPTIEKPYGLFYVCGPTGSGKTTTLHSILKHLNTPETKIWTAEDPVEITQKGLRQIQINKKAGIDFALVMRAFLRADPDIIMVGESRDHETVSMGVEASLTGHLVFSTLHTNSAPESIVRLLDMGMDPFNFADALLGILAQRLAKRLCSCKTGHTATPQELEALANEYAVELRKTPRWQNAPAAELQTLLNAWQQLYRNPEGCITLYEPVGCDTCQGTGYKGRLGLHELLLADDSVKRLIQERARVADLRAACLAEGMHTLKMDGIQKVLMGLTDIKQVRVAAGG